MEAGKFLNLLNEMFPGCEVFESAEGVLEAGCPKAKKFYRHKVGSEIAVYSRDASPVHGSQQLYCNYHGKIRVTDDRVCKYHLEMFDSWCWERCETEWAIKRLRPPLGAVYRQHKSSMPQMARFSSADAQANLPLCGSETRRYNPGGESLLHYHGEFSRFDEMCREND